MSHRNVRTTNIFSEIRPDSTFQKKTISNTAVAGPTVQDTSLNVLVGIDGDAVRVRFDGIDPDASTGHLLANGTRELWSRDTYSMAKFIRVTNDATLSVQGFKT